MQTYRRFAAYVYVVGDLPRRVLILSRSFYSQIYFDSRFRIRKIVVYEVYLAFGSADFHASPISRKRAPAEIYSFRVGRSRNGCFRESFPCRIYIRKRTCDSSKRRIFSEISFLFKFIIMIENTIKISITI